MSIIAELSPTSGENADGFVDCVVNDSDYLAALTDANISALYR